MSGGIHVLRGDVEKSRGADKPGGWRESGWMNGAREEGGKERAPWTQSDGGGKKGEGK